VLNDGSAQVRRVLDEWLAGNFPNQILPWNDRLIMSIQVWHVDRGRL
jgi:hypothetical protein